MSRTHVLDDSLTPRRAAFGLFIVKMNLLDIKNVLRPLFPGQMQKAQPQATPIAERALETTPQPQLSVATSPGMPDSGARSLYLAKPAYQSMEGVAVVLGARPAMFCCRSRKSAFCPD